jgi:hypothetical protein
VRFCERYPEIIERFDRFWEGRETDRPVLFISAPKEHPDTTARAAQQPRSRSVKPPQFASPTDRVRPEHVLAQARYRLARTAYYAEGYPHFFVNFGPGILHACIGGEANFSFENTTWFPKFLPDITEFPELRFLPDGRWWSRMMAVTERLLDELGDELVVSLTDIGGVADVLASAVGNRQLLLDVVDRPEAVKAALWHGHKLWLEAYEADYTLISAHQDVTTPWWPVLSRGRTYMTQCDFNAMISPKLFRDLFADELGAIYQHLDHGAYHLDGLGTEGHVAALVALQGLHCIQWVPAPGTSALDHAGMLRQIQEAGVSITFNISVDEVEIACREFDPRRLMLNVECASGQQAETLIENALRWCECRRGAGH